MAAIVVVGAQLALLPPLNAVPDHSDNFGLLVLLSFIAIPCGAFAGALAGRVRDDRLLVLAGFALAIPTFLCFASVLLEHSPTLGVAKKLIGTSAIPLFVAACVLERWTRPVAAIPVAAPQRRHRPWSIVERAVILSIGAAILVATMIARSEPPKLDEYDHWYKTDAAFGTGQLVPTFVFLVGSAIPVGVLLGRLASTLTTYRLFALLAVAGVGTIWIGGCVAVFSPLELRGIYLLPPVIAVIVLERVSQPRRESERLSAASIGMLLGGANAIAISAGLLALVLYKERWQSELLLIACVALLFALPAGAILGGIARRVRTHRRLVLHAIALFGVGLLALGFELPILRETAALGFSLWACFTTAIGVHILERATRNRA